MSYPPRPLAERFWEKVAKGKPEDCWPWLASTRDDGYGKFRIAQRTTGAHRVAYQLERGPIPDGLTIDHLCRNRACVNPDHLEVVTLAENVRRGNQAQRGRHKALCPRGHHIAGPNLFVRREGWHQCRICQYLRSAERHQSDLGVVTCRCAERADDLARELAAYLGGASDV